MASHDTVSRSELERLKRELSDMRKAAGLPEPVKAEHHPKEVYASATLVESMERLHGVLEKLLKLFENANREIYDGYERGLKDTDARLEQVIMQNEKIARGVVALADMLKQRPAPQSRSSVTSLPDAESQSEQEEPAIPPPPRFEPTPMQGGVGAGQRTQQYDEESFIRQPVMQLNPAPQMSSTPPVTRPNIPSLSTLAPASTSASPLPPLPLPPLQSAVSPLEPATVATRPDIGDLSPSSSAGNAGRRTLLDKFSFK